MLVVPRRLLVLGMRRDQRGVDIDREALRHAVKLPEPSPRAGVRMLNRVQHPWCRPDPLDHPERGRVRRHRPEQHALLTSHAQVRDALAAVGEHHRELPDHHPRVMTTTALLEPRQTQRQRAREPDLPRDPTNQRRTRVRHQPRSVRRHLYGYRASITHHPQGETSKPRIKELAIPRIPAQPDDSAPPNPEGASLTARSGLGTGRHFSFGFTTGGAPYTSVAY
jgi:hypothetical protein